MCGRFTLRRDTDEVVERFSVENIEFEITPRYNIAPSQLIPVITDSGVRTLSGYKWGLVPFWAKDPKIGNKMINARAETLTEKASFRQALTRRRCIIPADGFYEWKKSAKASQPLMIRRRDNELFGFAGLWEQWRSPEGEPLHTCTIITVDPNELIAPIHSRMAAILKPEHEKIWLDPEVKDSARLLSLLAPYPQDQLEAFEVSRRVNAPTIDDPQCIEPMAEE